jgi:hypothetical protein
MCAVYFSFKDATFGLFFNRDSINISIPVQHMGLGPAPWEQNDAIPASLAKLTVPLNTKKNIKPE